MLKHGLSIYTYYFGPTTQKYLLHIKLTILYTQDNTSLEMAFELSAGLLPPRNALYDVVPQQTNKSQ